ncbi:hypothetical protein ABG768_018245 [Culter alburnus]|uniref:Uncharacterized protein n=1 Tax=Culter alburnus TaxID=194366 RepID=A0AAW1YTQ6_CULAL
MLREFLQVLVVNYGLPFKQSYTSAINHLWPVSPFSKEAWNMFPNLTETWLSPYLSTLSPLGSFIRDHKDEAEAVTLLREIVSNGTKHTPY